MSDTEIQRASILVVDDTEANVDILLETLSDEYAVSVATDGPTALELATESPPDLVLLDVMMPEMDGYEVCERLKADERTRDVPVIFVTAMGELTDEMKGFELGAVDYITKPVSPPIVQARVSAHLGLQSKTRQLRDLSRKLSKYLSPQVYVSIFRGEQDAQIASTRRKLTIFFSDIVSFTRTTEDMESEDLSALLNNYLEEMANIALKHGGTIDKFIGDAILIFFGDPLSRGDQEDALACVSMAIEMQQRMQELQKRWYEFGIQEPFRIRIGISTGYCTVGNFGSRNRMDYTIIGSRVNLASRLESAAAPDQILISHETWSLIRDKVYCIKLRPVTVKGIGHAVHTYQVVDFIDNMAAEENAITIGFVAEPARGIESTMTVRELKASCGDARASELVAVVVEDDQAVGIVMGHHLIGATENANDAAVYLNEPVTTVMDSNAMLMEAETPLRQVGSAALARSEDSVYDPVVITTGGALLGIVPMHVLARRMIDVSGTETLTVN